MGGRSADRIENLIANHQVDVCTLGPERIVTRQPEIWTGLPPTVLSTQDSISEAGIEVCSRPNAPPWRRNQYPLALPDLMPCCGLPIHFDDCVRYRMREPRELRV